MCPSSLQVLLVSSSKEPDKWVVPGGGIEPNEQAHLAALREVREEAGVEGHLGRCLGVFEVSVSIPNFYYLWGRVWGRVSDGSGAGRGSGCQMMLLALS